MVARHRQSLDPRDFVVFHEIASMFIASSSGFEKLATEVG